MQQSTHVPVLIDEVCDALAVAPNDTVVDCTLGAGGHARALLSAMGTDGTFVGIDADPAAIAQNAGLKQAPATVHLVHDRFAHIEQILATRNIESPNCILADLGWRIEQFVGSGKGFSFQHDEPLVMTYGDPTDYPFTAYDVVNEFQEESIADIIYGYGEERGARRIARAIVRERERAPITTARMLADVVLTALPAHRRRGKIHPATRTFQALRMAVNDELGDLKTLLTDGFRVLAPGGRFAVITFHSIEDRIVKHQFRAFVTDGNASLQTKRPITADTDELQANPRARSAKLRVLTKH